MFAQVATAWLHFLGMVEDPPHSERSALLSGGEVDEFIAHQRDERGLFPHTVAGQRWHVEGFLNHVSSSKASIASLTVADVDAFLESKGREDWCRVSVASCATALRSFFRYAEKRQWCSPKIAAAIDAPRLFKEGGSPEVLAGPTSNGLSIAPADATHAMYATAQF